MRCVSRKSQKKDRSQETAWKRGDTLAPFLFIIVLDYALRQGISGWEQELGFRSRRLSEETMTDLDNADEICRLSNYVEQAQVLLTRVETECAKVGLKLNAKKTEVALR